MTLTTHERPQSAPDAFLAVELHSRYHEVIERYVRKRIHDPELAASVLGEVHRSIVRDPEWFARNPLPRLIAVARRETVRALTPSSRPTGHL